MCANHSAVITDTIEADDAWCPPDLHIGVAATIGVVDNPSRKPQQPAVRSRGACRY